MLTLFVVFLVVATGIGVLFAMQDSDVLVEAPPDQADVDLPAGRVVAEDLRAVRFGMVLRGYRMSEVDDVLSRLGDQLAERDERIVDLERALAEIVEPAVHEVESQQAARAPVPEEPPPGTPDEPLTPAAPLDDTGLEAPWAEPAGVPEAVTPIAEAVRALDHAASFHLPTPTESVPVAVPVAASAGLDDEPVEVGDVADEVEREPADSAVLATEPEPQTPDAVSKPDALSEPHDLAPERTPEPGTLVSPEADTDAADTEPSAATPLDTEAADTEPAAATRLEGDSSDATPSPEPAAATLPDADRSDATPEPPGPTPEPWPWAEAAVDAGGSGPGAPLEPLGAETLHATELEPEPLEQQSPETDVDEPSGLDSSGAELREDQPSGVPEGFGPTSGHLEDGLDFPEIPAAEEAAADAVEAVEERDPLRPEG